MSPTIKILIVAIASASYGTYGYCILKKWKAEDKRGVKPNEGQTRLHLTIIALGSTGIFFLNWFFFRHIGIYAESIFFWFGLISFGGALFFFLSFFYWRYIEENLTVEDFGKRGSTYYKRNKYDLAIRDYDKVLLMDPENFGAYYDRGLAYHKKGDYERAIQDYDKVIKLNPDIAMPYYSRGNAFKDAGKYKLAVGDYDKAIELDPENDMFYCNRANVHAKSGEYDLAIRDYDKAIELDPGDAEVYFNKAFACENWNKKEEAIKSYKKFLAVVENSLKTRKIITYVKKRVEELGGENV